jgi:hypothetical protein
MNRTSPIAAAVLLSFVVLASRADAQATAPPANPNSPAAIRAARIRAAQAAAAAAAKAPPPPTTPPVVTPPPTTPPVTATVAPKATATAPKAIATAPAASGSVKPVTSAAPAAVALPTHTDTAAIALDLDALKKTRPDRRHAEFLDLQARFGGLLSDPRATAELKQHAQRIAYLQRVRALGVKANDANFVKGVDALITTEETRDANALNSFRTGALPVPVAATATAVAVPVATAPAAGASK